MDPNIVKGFWIYVLMHGPNPNTSLLTVCNFIVIFERTNDREIKASLRMPIICSDLHIGATQTLR